ncbi:hypothetical protein Peur_027794 [Populus x canadensis]
MTCVFIIEASSQLFSNIVWDVKFWGWGDKSKDCPRWRCFSTEELKRGNVVLDSLQCLKIFLSANLHEMVCTFNLCSFRNEG